MSEGIGGFLAAATSPAKLRARLRRETAPVRRLPPALAAIDGVRAVFPASLLGHELLGLLGERLRGLVLDVGNLREGEGGLRRLAAHFASRFAAEGAAALPILAQPEPVAAPWPVSRHGAGELGRAPSAPGESLGQARAGSALRPAPQGRAPKPLTGAALLEDRLRRYWRTAALALEQRAARPGQRSTLDPAERARSSRSQGASASLLRAPMTDVEIARELRAFVGERLAAPSARAGVRPSGDEDAGSYPFGYDFASQDSADARLTATPPFPAAPSHTLGATFGVAAASRAAARRELADELAAILREQALRHGIDLP